MPRNEQILAERYRRGDTIRAVIKSVEFTSKGPDIIISRSDNHFLYKLFEMEVPEIEDGIIDIIAIARHPGSRAKIIVKSNDRRIDPVGACVGMRGSRIQAIVRELNNEKIDIINSSEQAEILVSRALSPAKPVQLFIDDDKNYCIALFEDENLDAAIGKNGMNINLASKVTEYKIDAYGVKQYEQIRADQQTPLSDIEGISAEVSKGLSDIGISVVSQLLDADMEEILKAQDVNEDSLDEIYEAVQTFIEREIEIEEPETEEEVEIVIESEIDEEENIVVENDTSDNDDKIQDEDGSDEQESSENNTDADDSEPDSAEDSIIESVE